LDRIHELFENQRIRQWARRLVPLVVAALLVLLLSPGLARLRGGDEVRPGRAPEPAADAAGGAGLAQTHEYAALKPAFTEDLDLLPPVREEPAIPAQDGSAGADDPASSFDCIVEPWEVVHIGSPVTGVIEEISVERSDLVEAGQVVARLESGVERAAIEVARARAEKKGEVEAREASLELGRSRNNRVSQLFERETLSLDLREQAETEAKIARLELLAAREDKRLASLELEQARQALKRRSIRTPISGVVVDRLMSPGEVVDEDRILTIAQIDPLRVEVILPSAMFGRFPAGSRAAVTPEFPGDQVHVASVSIVDRVIDAASGTFGVRLELSNPNQKIPGGLHCQVRFLTE
jgi:RND family efflux transporter MFP subunit